MEKKELKEELKENELDQVSGGYPKLFPKLRKLNQDEWDRLQLRKKLNTQSSVDEVGSEEVGRRRKF
jgi:bacteriocin-like protein